MRWALANLLFCSACAPSGAAWQAGAGTYVAELPAKEGAGQRLTLELLADGHAALLHDHHNGKPVQRESARWEPVNGQIKLFLFGLDTGTVNGGGSRLEVKQTLVFEHEKQGLKAVEWDKALWGSAGLDLMKQSATPTLP